MTNTFEKCIKELLEQIDHDLADEYYAETAEEPEFAEENRQELINILADHFPIYMDEENW